MWNQNKGLLIVVREHSLFILKIGLENIFILTPKTKLAQHFIDLF